MKPQRFCDLLRTKHGVYKTTTNLTMWEKKGYFVAGKDKHGRRKFNTPDVGLIMIIIAMETIPNMSSKQIKDTIEGNDKSCLGDMIKQMDECEAKWFPILREWINGKERITKKA